MATTINTLGTVGIRLSESPVIVTDTGGVEANGTNSYALYGDASQSWQIGNDGLLTATGSNSVGITLAATGTISNGDSTTATATISGDGAGIAIAGADAAVTNYGTISGGQAGVTLARGGMVANAGQAAVISSGSFGVYFGVSAAAGGVVTNAPGAIITGQTQAIYIAGSVAVSVLNNGEITGAGVVASGIKLDGGGTVVNGSDANTTAVIATTGDNGIEMFYAAGSVANYGTIRGGVEGVALYGGGDVVNGSPQDTTAYIFGGTSAGVDTSGTLTNFGTVVNRTRGGGVYGGTVINGSAADTKALIKGYNSGIGYDTVVANFGTVLATRNYGAGIFNNVGGTVTNGSTSDAVAFVSGYHGVNIENGGLLQNFGTVAASRSDIGPGVQVASGGTIVNGAPGDTTALIAAAPAGNADFSDGIRLYSGVAVVTNFGIVTGEEGVYVDTESASATITNAGTISAIGGGVAASLNGKNNLLVVDPGAVFGGSVVARASGAASTLELAGGSGGTISGIGTEFQNFNSVAVAAGAQWQFDGANTIGSGATLTVAGSAGGSGTVVLQGGTADVSAGQVATTLGFDFADAPHDRLTVAGSGGQFANPLANLRGTDRIEVAGGIAFDSATLTGSTLDLTSGGSTVFAFPDVALATGVPAHFLFGTDTTSNNAYIEVACLAAGTRILGDGGEVEVERLAPGARVVSLLHGRLLPIQWVGRRRIDCAHHPRPEKVWPVCVRAGAFAPGMPHRDLWLSPDHAVFVDGALVPVRTLINGASIAQAACDTVEYFHLELIGHGVLLAEGLPAESYLDTGNRFAFENGGPALDLHPDFAQAAWHAAACAPQITHGPIHFAVDARLQARAMMTAEHIASTPESSRAP